MLRFANTSINYLLTMMAKKQPVSRVNKVYSKTKDSLGSYYKRELSTTKSTRVVVWEKDGYDLMVGKKEVK